MRKIEFKGKAVKYKEWVYGYYVKSRKHHYILQQYNESGYDGRWETSEWIEVDPETVGQFTGVHDIKGRKLYEKDICFVGEYYIGDSRIREHKNRIVFNDGWFCFDDGIFDMSPELNSAEVKNCKIELIGNPEPLEEK